MSTPAPNQLDHEIENRFSYFGLIPVMLSIALVVIFRVWLPSAAVFEPPYLLSILNTVFLALMPFTVAFLAGRSYVATGSLNILLIGCALLVFGAGNLVAGWAIEHPGPNSTVTIHNIASLAASIFYVMAAFVLAEGTTESAAARRAPKLFFAYFTIILFVALLSVATILGLMPPFFVVGKGPTPLREIVLTVAIVLQTFSAVFALRLYWKRRMPFLYWYGLALLLIAAGLAAVLMEKAVGSPIGWLGRISQYVGGIYFVAAAIVTVREARTADTSVGKALASFFRESKLHYKNLVETAQDAIISTDSRGQILLWNPAAKELFGFARREAVGSRLNDLVGLDSSLLVEAGPARSHANTRETTLRKKDGSVFPSEVSAWTTEVAEGKTVTFVVHDITERKRAEERIRHLASFPELNPYPIIEVNASGEVTFFNPATQEILGSLGMDKADCKALLSEDLYSVLRDWDKKSESTLDREVTVGDRVFGEMIFLTPGFNAARIYVYDITERKRMEEALCRSRHELELRVQERTEELRKANAQLLEEARERGKMEEQAPSVSQDGGIGTLAGGIAHDFNNMLPIIMGIAELALDDAPRERDGIQHNLDAIFKAAKRGRDLVKQILTFSRKSEQQQETNLSPLLSRNLSTSSEPRFPLP